jgi:CubicO group peptidase (beta-lactamase class C family)
VRIRPPGEVSAYDTYGVTLAGHLVEQVSGTDYATYLRENIFAPLGMNRSGIAIPAALQADAAVGYGFAGEWEAMPWEYMNTAPASSVNATVTDMARLATMLLNGGELEGRRILSERSVREMLSRQFTNDPDQPGYGYLFFENDWNGITTFSHGGSMEGFAAMLYLVPDYDLGFFIACNQESSAVIDPTVETLLGALFPDARPTKLRKRYGGDVDLSRFTGTYANNVYHHADPESGWTRHPFQLEATDDGALLFDGKPARPVGPLTFQRDDGLLLSFRENDHGRITHLFVKQAVYEKLD